MGDVQMAAVIVAAVSLVRRFFPVIDGRAFVAGVSALIGAVMGAASAKAAGEDWGLGAAKGLSNGLAAFGAVHVADRVAGVSK